MTKLKSILLATAALGVSVVFADKLSDLKDADRYDRGCNSIPAFYSSERSACNSEGPEVHKWCDGAQGPISCGNQNETTSVKRAVEDAENKIKDIERRKSSAESNKSNAKTDDEKRRAEEEVKKAENDLNDAKKALETAKTNLENRKKHVEAAIVTLDKCIAYRRAVMNSFASALDKIRNESDTDEIKNLARSLRNKYEAEKSGHEQAITQKKNAYDNCRDWRP